MRICDRCGRRTNTFEHHSDSVHYLTDKKENTENFVVQLTVHSQNEYCGKCLNIALHNAAMTAKEYLQVHPEKIRIEPEMTQIGRDFQYNELSSHDEESEQLEKV